MDMSSTGLLKEFDCRKLSSDQFISFINNFIDGLKIHFSNVDHFYYALNFGSFKILINGSVYITYTHTAKLKLLITFHQLYNNNWIGLEIQSPLFRGFKWIEEFDYLIYPGNTISYFLNKDNQDKAMNLIFNMIESIYKIEKIIAFV